MTSYADFLACKIERVPHIGPVVDVDDVHTLLHDWQRELVVWAVRVGRAALWADTGLGKTLMQIEWARLSGDRVLLVAPLAVCRQTVREAAKVNVDVRYLRADDGLPGIVITNYEMTDHFDAGTFDAVVLDESSILKDVTSKTRERLIEQFAVTPRRLACTATPAPNDASELANHAEFLGVATRREMLSTYFVHDQDGWRAKGHARRPMFAWMSTWAVAVRRPSDLGYDDEGYLLPGLLIERHLVDADVQREGELIPLGLGGVTGRAEVRRLTLKGRCEKAVQLVEASHDLPTIGGKLATWSGSLSTPRIDAGSATQPAAASPSTTATTPAGSGASSAGPAISDSASSEMTQTSSLGRSTTWLEPWVIWCGLNDEQEFLREAFGDRCFSVTGSQPPEQKVDLIDRWLVGERPILLTKPSIAGMGINMQHCARMAFVGLSDSYEAYYQSIRRCYRYGQSRVVVAHIILSDIEAEIATNVSRKEAAAAAFTGELVDAMRSAGPWKASA